MSEIRISAYPSMCISFPSASPTALWRESFTFFGVERVDARRQRQQKVLHCFYPLLRTALPQSHLRIRRIVTVQSKIGDSSFGGEWVWSEACGRIGLTMARRNQPRFLRASQRSSRCWAQRHRCRQRWILRQFRHAGDTGRWVKDSTCCSSSTIVIFPSNFDDLCHSSRFESNDKWCSSAYRYSIFAYS